MVAALGERYEVRRRIALGGMAEVFEAFDRRLNRPVAIKVMRTDLADEMARQRFAREALLSARFNHPNAVTTLDVGEDGTRPYLVMELVEGEDLAQHLAESGPMPADRAVAVADSVLRALAAAHAEGIAHRDVKPSNILLGNDGRVRLADFGIAKAMADATGALTAPGLVIGSAAYLAPEQRRGLRCTGQSDLYSVGVVLHEMLVGQPPHPDDTLVATLDHSAPGIVPSLVTRRPDLPPHVLAVVERALEPEPARRFANAESMRRALLEPEADAATATLLMPAADEATAPQPAATTAYPIAPEHDTRGVDVTKALRRMRRSAVLLAAGTGTALAVLGVSRWRSGDDQSLTTSTSAAASSVAAATAPASTAVTLPPTSSTLAASTTIARASTTARPSTTTRLATTVAATQPATTSPRTTVAADDLPDDLGGLVSLLSSEPSAYGERGSALLAELRHIQSINPKRKGGRERREAVAATIDNIDGWARDDELSPELAARTRDVLRRLVD